MLRKALRSPAAPLSWLALTALLSPFHTAAGAAGADLYGDPLPPAALARLGTARFRHPSACVAYSPDGKLLASGGTDNTIRLFEASTGKALRTLTGHQARTYNPPRNRRSPVDVLVSSVGEGQVNCLAFSPDGKVLASGGWDDSVRLWDVTSGTQLRRLEAHKGMVAAVAFSPDGKTLASRGGIDGAVCLWDPATGDRRHRTEGLSPVNPWRFNRQAPLAFSPDGKTLAAGDRKVIRLYDAASGKPAGELTAHAVCVSLAYSRDGKWLASGGVDGKDKHSLRLWDAASGKEVRRCALPKDEPPIHAAFSPDGRQLAAAVEEDDVRLFDVATGKPAHRLGHYWASRVAFSPDGKTLATARGPAIRLWDPAGGKERFLDFRGHQAAVTSLAVSPDGNRVATAAADGVRLWDAKSAKPVRVLATRAAAVAFSPDGRTLASAGRDRVLHLWDAAGGKPVRDFKGHKHPLCGLAFSPDGKTLASGDVQATIRLWEVSSGKELRQIDMKSGAETLSLAFTPDGKYLACAGAWNDSSFLPKGGINIQGVLMTPKQGYLVLLWDPTTGKEVRRFAGLPDNIKSLAFAPDGKLLAAASRDGRIALWETATGKERLYIMAHPRHADVSSSASPALAFSPDGKTLASASTDRTARVWDVATGKQLRLLRGPQQFLALAAPRDGKTLICAGTGTAALVWDLAAPPADPKAGEPKVIFIRD